LSTKGKPIKIRAVIFRPALFILIFLILSTSGLGYEQSEITEASRSRSTDTDGDGMKDGWEIAYGLDPTDNGSINPDNGAYGDPDNDAVKNLDEYNWSINPKNWDTDSDGIPDGWEIKYGLVPFSADGATDRELDGLTNLQEYCYGIPGTWTVPNDGVYWNGTNPNEQDTDNDTMKDGWEAGYGLDPRDNGTIDINNGPAGDPDRDAMPNGEEFKYSTNATDWDTENDGMPDGWEWKYGLDPYRVDGDKDKEYDGLTNFFEYSYCKPDTWNVSKDSVWWNGTNPSESDTDSDNMPDGWEVDHELDPRDDGSINIDNGPSGDPDKDSASNYKEFITGGDPWDWDSDSDGMPDGWELKYEFQPSIPEGDKDTDSDALANADEYRYNIPKGWNVSVDGVWWNGTDPTDSDTDDDGLKDGWETWYYLDPLDDGTIDPNNGGSGDPDNDFATNLEEYNFILDPLYWDSDHDGTPDGWEIFYGLNPNFPSGNDDKDSDTLTDLKEYLYDIPLNWNVTIDGVWWNGTNPTKKDTDNDTFPDDWEIKYGFDPRDPEDPAEDPDSDSLTTLDEYQLGTSPITNDTDNDGSPDGTDEYPLDPSKWTSDDDIVDDPEPEPEPDPDPEPDPGPDDGPDGDVNDTGDGKGKTDNGDNTKIIDDPDKGGPGQDEGETSDDKSGQGVYLWALPVIVVILIVIIIFYMFKRKKPSEGESGSQPQVTPQPTPVPKQNIEGKKE
jgi:hypothetical protein